MTWAQGHQVAVGVGFKLKIYIFKNLNIKVKLLECEFYIFDLKL